MSFLRLPRSWTCVSYSGLSGKSPPSSARFSCFRVPSFSASMSAERCAFSQSKLHLLLVSDLDLTMVDHNDIADDALIDFNCIWASEYAKNSHLVYATGRSMQRYLDLQKNAPLVTPNALILSVGTEIRLGPSFEIDNTWTQGLDDGWDRDVIVEETSKISCLRFQEGPEQGSHKVSMKVDMEKGLEAQKILSERLLQRGLKVQVLYSSGIDIDVLPHKAGKGQALSYLLKNLNQNGIAHENVLVCGDSGNDVDLFSVKGIQGVIVANAQQELIEWHQLQGSGSNIFRASKRCAGGIVEALQHFRLADHSYPSFQTDHDSFHPATEKFSPFRGSIYREVVQLSDFLLKWMLGKVSNTELSFTRLSGVINDRIKAVLPDGIELTASEFLDKMKNKHGSMQASGLRIWLDKIDAQQLSDSIYLMTWQTWEQIPGEPKRGFFSSAIFRPKAGTPNGAEWLYFHRTTMSTTGSSTSNL